MINVVVDSSVAIKWFVVEPYSDEAQAILDGYKAGEINLLAPDLINAEVGNIVWKKHRLQNLDVEDAQEIINTFKTLGFTFTSSIALLGEAYKIAVTHDRTVYDMMYVALSKQEECQFITADERMVNAIGTHFPEVVWIANWRNPVKENQQESNE
jgi:predicted nucleic acid-binding protein